MENITFYSILLQIINYHYWMENITFYSILLQIIIIAMLIHTGHVVVLVLAVQQQ